MSNSIAGQWTPDGRHFLFSSNREGHKNVYELVAPRWFEFWKKPAPRKNNGQPDPHPGLNPEPR